MIPDLVGCLGPMLLAACLLAWKAPRAIAVLGVLAVGWVPVDGLALVFHLRSLVGEFSIPTLVLLGGVLAGRGRILDSASRGALLAFGLAGGVLLYPFALGLPPLDPYAWGFRLTLPLLLLPLTLALFSRGRVRAAYVLAVAVSAFHLRVLASDNLWDYVLDPVLVFWGLGWAIRAWRRRRAA